MVPAPPHVIRHREFSLALAGFGNRVLKRALLRRGRDQKLLGVVSRLKDLALAHCGVVPSTVIVRVENLRPCLHVVFRVEVLLTLDPSEQSLVSLVVFG